MRWKAWRVAPLILTLKGLGISKQEHQSRLYLPDGRIGSQWTIRDTGPIKSGRFRGTGFLSPRKLPGNAIIRRVFRQSRATHSLLHASMHTARLEACAHVFDLCARSRDGASVDNTLSTQVSDNKDLVVPMALHFIPYRCQELQFCLSAVVARSLPRRGVQRSLCCILRKPL